ncbi:MAG: NTP transferase domain-containing protein [Acidobacteria bacterium]|nr:NTP transferase domain-containing protein [Acidobacteriota bacterium]
MTRLMIIPAAGLGTRLSAAVPKVLLPVNGKPMLDILLDLYRGSVDRFLLVLNPLTRGLVEAHCARRTERIDIDLQPEPTGMLDAVLVASTRVQMLDVDRIWITWCDQAAVHPRTVARLAELEREHPDASLILPTVRRARPYTHLVRDSSGGIVGVKHAREGDDMPEIGESDMGLFSLSRKAYLQDLARFQVAENAGLQTRQRNFLPFVASESSRGQVVSFSAQHEIEAIGINTVDELQRVADYLCARDAAQPS